MTEIHGSTRERLRKSIGRNLIGHRLIVSAATSDGDATRLIDNTLLGGDDNYNGWWLVANSPGANGGSIRRVSDYDSTGARLSWTRPLPQMTVINDSYELWPSEYPPEVIHDYINQAIGEAAGHIYEPVEDESLHTGGGRARFPIPKGMDAISKVQVGVSASRLPVHQFGAVFGERTATGWEQSVDASGLRKGASSLRIGIAAQAQNGGFIADSVGPLDLSASTHLEGWIRSERALAADDVVVHLNTGPVQADGNDAESLGLPETEAGRWTYFHVALANPWDDGAIASVGIEYRANIAEGTLWFDDLRAVDAGTVLWRTLPTHLWGIDKGERVLTLTDGGRRLAGYAPLKLVGGREPSPASTDASRSVVPDEFIIARAMALALRATPDLSESGAAACEGWDAQTRDARAAFPLLTNVRRVG